MKKLLLSLSAIAALSMPALADTYKLVTDVAELNEACDVIVVGANGSNYYAIATTTNTNNRKTVGVTVNDGMIVDPGETVGIFNVEKKETNYTFYFSNYEGIKGYLAATSSSSNNLGVKADIDANGEATVSIADTGLASVVFQGSNTRNKMRFNYNNGTPLFACYVSNTSTGTDVYFYKKDANAVAKTPAVLTFDETKCTADLGAAFTAPKLDKETDGALTWTSSNEEVATVSADGTPTLVGVGVTTITVASAETNDYYGATASYKLVVLDPESNTVVFADRGYENKDLVTSVSVGLADLLFSKGEGATDPAYYDAGTQVRTYNSNTLTVTVPEGYVLKSITFVHEAPNSAGTKFWCMELQEEQSGSVAVNEDDNECVWTPAEGDDVNSVSFINVPIYTDENKLVANQSRLQSVTVEWEALKAPVTVPALEATDKNGVFTFEAEEGVTYTYTLNGAAEQLEVKGDTISVADLASATLYAILLHADGVAAEAPVYAVTTPAPVLAASDNAGKRMLTCTAGEGVTVYYRVVNAIEAYAAEDWTVLPAAGAEVEEGSEIEVKASALTPEDAAVESDVVALDIPTGIVAIEADGAVKVYDLSGRAVSGELQPGIYVVVEGGKATKVVVR